MVALTRKEERKLLCTLRRRRVRCRYASLARRGQCGRPVTRAACTDLIRLSPSCALSDPEGDEIGAGMPGTKTDRRAARASAAANRNDELIARAGKRADLAGAALQSAAGDLKAAHSSKGDPLTGLAELVLDEARRVSRLAEDISSQEQDSNERAWA